MSRKIILWTLKMTNKQNLIQEKLDRARNRNRKRETESPLIASQNNALRTISKRE